MGNPIAGTRVLITGASGFIGRHLSRALLGMQGQVVAMGFRSAGRCDPGCIPVTCDIQDADSVHSLISRYKPDLVYHLAGYVSAFEDPELVLPMMDINLRGSVHLLSALRGTSCRRAIMAGTCEEDEGETPRSPYGVAKTCARIYASYFARYAGLSVVHARLDLVYGPDQPEHRLVPYIVRTLLNGGEPALRNPDRRFGYVYIDDAVSALLQCGTASDIDGHSVDITSGDRRSIRDLSLLLRDIVRGSGYKASQPEVTHFAAATGMWCWRPCVTLEQGLRATVAFSRHAAAAGG